MYINTHMHMCAHTDALCICVSVTLYNRLLSVASVVLKEWFWRKGTTGGRVEWDSS